MKKIYIRPLSVNSGWQGRRFKNQAYKDYEKELLYLLPQPKETLTGEIRLDLVFGLEKKSYKKMDVDNMIKFFTDCLNKKGFFENDNQIVEILVRKEIAADYFIKFDLKEL